MIEGDLKAKLKYYAQIEGLSLTDILKLLNKKGEIEDQLSSLSRKLKNKTIKYSEVEEILNIIGYKIVWEKKKNLSK